MGILPSLQRLDLDWPNPKNPDRPPPERVPHPFDASRDVCLSFHDPDKTGSLADLREIAGRNRQSLGELLALFFRHYAWAHVLKYPKHQLVRKEFMRASKLIDDAAA